MSKPILSRQSRWLLAHLSQLYPLGLSSVVPMPCHWSEQPGMQNLNGLIRRGWAEEKYQGVYCATVDGLKANETLPQYPKPDENT